MEAGINLFLWRDQICKIKRHCDAYRKPREMSTGRLGPDKTGEIIGRTAKCRLYFFDRTSTTEKMHTNNNPSRNGPNSKRPISK
jgi:hypothetical protein